MDISRGLVAIVKGVAGVTFPAVACTEGEKNFWTPIGPGTTRGWTAPSDSHIWRRPPNNRLPDPIDAAKKHHSPYRMEILGGLWVSYLNGKLTEAAISEVKRIHSIVTENQQAQEKLDFAAHVKTATPPWEEETDDAPNRTPGPGLVRYNIGMEAWREYFWVVDDEDGNWRNITYRINKPRVVAFRPGGTTHRVLDSEGIVHCVPAPGERGCVLRWPGEISF